MRRDAITDIENNGKFIKSELVIKRDITDYLSAALEFGELNSSMILDIESLEIPNESEPINYTVVLFDAGKSKAKVGLLEIT